MLNTLKFRVETRTPGVRCLPESIRGRRLADLLVTLMVERKRAKNSNVLSLSSQDEIISVVRSDCIFEYIEEACRTASNLERRRNCDESSIEPSLCCRLIGCKVSIGGLEYLFVHRWSGGRSDHVEHPLLCKGSREFVKYIIYMMNIFDKETKTN